MFKFYTYYKSILIFTLINIISFSAFSQKQSILKSNTNNFVISSSFVPDSIISSVEYATSVWSNYIYSPVPINIKVYWRDLADNVSAYAKPGSVIKNIEGLPYTDVLYPIALAEKISGRNLNYDSPDIELVINSNILWHVQSNTTPIPNSYDLATIIIHELCHGLGMIGNFALQNSIPTLIGDPTIYDTYISYNQNEKLLDIFNKGTVSQDSLRKILTSNKIYWSGNYVTSLLGYKPQLYAPNPFNHGSSIYHFDEDLFPKDAENSLMTYILQKEEVIHEPGIAAISILADLGWNDYFISHDKISNITNINQNINFSINCLDTLFTTGTKSLLYSYDGGKNYSELLLNFDNINNNYNVDLPSLPFEHTISYAFRCVTNNNDTLYIPVEYPQNNYHVFVGQDIISPIIEHTPITSVPVNYNSIDFNASIRDNFELDSSYVKLIIGRNNFATILYNGNINLNDNGTFYNTNFLIDQLNLKEGDVIAYNIISVDKSKNTSYYIPKDEYLFILIEEVQQPIPFLLTDFESDTISEYFSLDKFSIYKENLFSNKALQTTHPYNSSQIDGKYIQYIADLKYPIIIAENPAIMEFDQIILVEPAEVGVNFGSYGFWDYVVVEATKDKKNGEWYVLGKQGYNSRSDNDWLETFYSSTSTENANSSTALGKESLYKKRTINLLENKYIRTGDTVYIRFRLQSDFDVNGWGWAIDNLKIQERLALSLNVDENIENNLYPIPCDGKLYVANFENIETITIVNTLGMIQYKKIKCENSIDVKDLKSGVYYAKILFKNGECKTQTIIKH